MIDEGENLVTVNPEELKRRLEHDENMWLKIQETANKQHADSLNQLADLFRIVHRLTARLEKLERKLDDALHREG